MRRSGGAAFALLALVAACSAPATPTPAPAPTPSAPPSASAASRAASHAPGPAPRPLDALFATWAKKRPEAATLSEQNGKSILCRDGDHATLTLLGASARKVVVSDDADLVALARWARHPDPCIRQIAMDAIVPAVGFDRNQLVVPHMHDPEHHLFHDIFVSLHARLGAKATALDPEPFAGMMLDATAGEVIASLRGTWIEDHGSKGFQVFVEVGTSTMAVTRKHVPGDPKFPDVTWTSELPAGKLDARRRYVVHGAWGFERHGQTDEPRQSPSPFVYSFWPVARDIVWFKDGEPAYWIKLRRAVA
jgi:hypothetical protein